MAGKLGKFQMMGFQGWRGSVTKDNHISAIYQSMPQKASQLMVRLLAYQNGGKLASFVNSLPTKEFESDDEYTWDIIGSARRSIPLIEARTIDGTVIASADADNVGANTEPFYLVFGEDWFADGEVIVGNLNEIYPMRILGDPKIEGTNAVYCVELMGGNTDGIPAERLLAGERFTIEYAPVEKELSRRVGDIRFVTPVSMRNEFSRVRIQHKVPGSMLNKKLAMSIPMVKRDANGKMQKDTSNYWMHYVEWELELQFQEYKDNLVMFGRSNRNKNGEYMNIGKSGNVIKMGAGLLEQMEVANTYYYNHFSLKLLERALYDISVSKLGMGERTFVIKTGERGAALFHKAANDMLSGWTQFIYDNNSTKIVQRTSSELHSNALSYGYQITEYKAPNNVTVRVEVDPWYDDEVRNKIQHPLGGPAMSYRFDIMDIGTMDQPNIFKCKIKGQEDIRGYQWGLRNPFTGQLGNPHMSFDEDSAIFHRYAALGVCVLDPTRTLSLIPAVLQG